MADDLTLYSEAVGSLQGKQRYDYLDNHGF